MRLPPWRDIKISASRRLRPGQPVINDHIARTFAGSWKLIDLRDHHIRRGCRTSKFD